MKTFPETHSKLQADVSAATPRRAALIAALVLAITSAVFVRVIHLSYLDWDDNLHVYENPHLSSFTGILWLWKHPYGGLYVPLSYTVFALLAHLAVRQVWFPTPEGGTTPLDPMVFHSANLALHLANTLLVFLILHRLLRRDWAAGAGALLFSLHPMQVESVAWISELRGLLCNFFSLLTLRQCLCLAQRDRAWPQEGWGYAAATTGFLLALLCKPSAVTLPLVILALDHWVIGRRWSRCAPPMLAWLLLSLVWLVITRGAQPLLFTPLPIGTRPLIAGDALWFYLGHLLWPAQLGPDYGRTPAWVLRHQAWETAAIPLLLGALLWRSRRRTPLWAAAAVFAAVLLPVLGLVPFAFQLYSTVSDRYLYLALLGPALVLGWALMATADSRRWSTVMGTSVVILLGFLALRSIQQIPTWQNTLTFTAHAVQVNPQSWVMLYNRGHYWERHGDDGDAVAEYQQALLANPQMADAHSNLGNLLLKHGLCAAADVQLREALRLEPTLPQAHVVLGLSLAEQGDDRDAVTQWQWAVQHWPNAGVIRYHLGMTLLRLGRVPDAVAQFQAILHANPQFAPAQVALARALHPLPHGSDPVKAGQARS